MFALSDGSWTNFEALTLTENVNKLVKSLEEVMVDDEMGTLFLSNPFVLMTFSKMCFPT